MFSAEDIFNAYQDCRKNKRNTYNALNFEIDCEANLFKLLKELNNGTYEIGKSICFVVTSPKLREVFAADFRDRIVHHLVIRKIEPYLEKFFIEDTYNCRTGKGVLFGIKRLEKKIKEAIQYYGDSENLYVAKFDCKGFFMSINRKLLADRISDFIDKNYPECSNKSDMIRVIRQITLHDPTKNCVRVSSPEKWKGLSKDKSLFTCGEGKGLPIGNLSSQILANFYMMDFDNKWSSRFNGFFGRYVDDFYIIAPKDIILESINEIRSDLLALGVTLHPNKFYLQHYTKGIKFIGGTVKPNRKYTNSSTIHNFRKCIKELNELDDKREQLEVAVSRINSYLGYCIHYSSFSLKVRVLAGLDDEWFKYLDVTENCSKVYIKEEFKKNDKKIRKNRRLCSSKKVQ